MTPPPPRSTLFPYTTLFRSQTRSFPKYTILEDPATWKPTPPAYMDAIEPHWNKIRPFAIDSATQFKPRSEEHTSELQSQSNLVCRLLLEKKKKRKISR